MNMNPNGKPRKSRINLLGKCFAAFTLFALLSLATPLHSTPASIGSGIVVWNSGPGYNGNSYEVFRVPGGITWYEAEARAVALGGHLVSIHSDDEDNFVASLINNQIYWEYAQYYERGPWIGGLLVDGNWTWSDGTPFDYTNWFPGQPDNFEGVENTIQFYGYTISNTWNDVNGDFKYPVSQGLPTPDSYVVEWTGEVPQATYTLLLSATDTSPSVPQGIGYATMTIGQKGGVLIDGRLPDGEKITLVGGLSRSQGIASFVVDHILPYPDVSSPGYVGFLFGSLNFVQISGTSNLNGTLTWIKPEQTAGAYPASIDTTLSVIGSSYVPPAPQGTVLPGFTTGTLTLSDSTGSILSATAVLAPPNQLALNPPADDLAVTINPLTGVFKGSFLYPGQTVPTGFDGVLFQVQASAAGFFIGPNGSGAVTLLPSP